MNQEHKVTQKPEGYYCEMCEQTFRNPPSGECPGVKLYSYTSIPWEQMTTATQLKERKLKPAKGQQAAGCYFRLKDKEFIYLYKIEDAVPRRTPTERQQQAIGKMREGLKRRFTCQRCGWYDYTHGQSRSKYYEGDIYALKVEGEEKLYCEDCRRYMIWAYDRHVIEYNMALLLSGEGEAKPFIVLDTETTSLPDQRGFQVVEIACVDKHANVVFHSLVKPNAPITAKARRKHGITDEMLEAAPAFPDIWPQLVEVLSTHEMWCYNAAFDKDAIISSAERYSLEVPKRVRSDKHWNCLMETFADYYGMYSHYHGSCKWQDLEFACEHLDVPVTGYHRALADAMNALGVMKVLADRGGTYPVPDEQPEYISSEYYGGDYDEDY